MLTRRELGFGAFGALLSVSDLETREVALTGAGPFGPSFVLATPRGGGGREALVVLLHGLAETVDPRLGRTAWLELYGLATAYTRLRRAPVERATARDDWGPGRLAALNASLATRPFRGFAIACPYLPNPWRAKDTGAALERTAAWLAEVLAPRARLEAGLGANAPIVVGGCSLGGFVALEALVRRPDAFVTFAGIQSAIGEGAARAYAERIAARPPRRDLVLVSSRGDPYLRANEALAAELAQRGIHRTLVVRPGPHDQPWLREAGTTELLYAVDAALAA